MTYQELIDAAKLRARKFSTDLLDEDVKTQVDYALKDMERIGVNKEKFLTAPEDPLVIGAVLAWVAAFYAMNQYHDKWLNCYNMTLTKLKGGDYK